MKTKRRATPLPSRPEQISPPTRNITNPSIGRDMACTSLTTKSLDPNNSSGKKSGHDNIIIFRRSTRIKNSVYRRPCIRGDTIEPVIQVIDPSGSEKDDPKDSEELLHEPELNQSPVKDIEPAPQNQDPAGSDKETEEDPSEENSLEPETEIPVQGKTNKNKSEMRYHTLYVESQKKIEELTQAKNELSMKLAVAEGKLEVYEKGSGILSSILDKAKDTFMASALSQATEHAFARTTSLVEPKRKRKPSTATTRKKPVANLG